MNEKSKIFSFEMFRGFTIKIYKETKQNWKQYKKYEPI